MDTGITQCPGNCYLTHLEITIGRRLLPTLELLNSCQSTLQELHMSLPADYDDDKETIDMRLLPTFDRLQLDRFALVCENSRTTVDQMCILAPQLMRQVTRLQVTDMLSLPPAFFSCFPNLISLVVGYDWDSILQVILKLWDDLEHYLVSTPTTSITTIGMLTYHSRSEAEREDIDTPLPNLVDYHSLQATTKRLGIKLELLVKCKDYIVTP